MFTNLRFDPSWPTMGQILGHGAEFGKMSDHSSWQTDVDQRYVPIRLRRWWQQDGFCLCVAVIIHTHGWTSTEPNWSAHNRTTRHWAHYIDVIMTTMAPQITRLNRLFRRGSKKTSKHRGTGLCVANSQGTGEFPAQRVSYAENVSIWWRHHGCTQPCGSVACCIAGLCATYTVWAIFDTT